MLFETDTEVVESNPTVITVKPRVNASLTDAVLKSLKPQVKAYKISDGKGLYVMVTPSGTKTFRLDYRIVVADGKPNRETLIDILQVCSPNAILKIDSVA